MEDLLANLSFLKTWIHEPAFPGLLYSGSCNLKKRSVRISESTRDCRSCRRGSTPLQTVCSKLRETYLLLVDDATNEVGIGVKSIR